MKAFRNNDLVKQGDSARDSGDWLSAANSYQKYLEREKGDFGIWVQLGNCLKEARHFDSALEAYDTALGLNPGDADLHLQRGHLFKLTNRPDEAVKAYEQSLNLDPGQNNAFRELISLAPRHSHQSHRDPVTGESLFLDVTDLLIYLRHNPAVSGIQRVISKIMDRVVSNADNVREFRNVQFVVLLGNEGKLIAVNPNLVLRVIGLIDDSSSPRDTVIAAIDSCYATATSMAPKPGDTFVILGAFWISPTYERLLMSLRESGVSVAVLIYDLLPITHRQFFDAELADDFTRNVIDVLFLCDFVMTISEYVAGETRNLLTRIGKQVKVQSIPLAHELNEPKNAFTSIRDEVKEVVHDDFVLCVGTLEVRKNHEYLLRVWQNMIAERGADKVPDLVLVGRWGWKIDGFRSALEESNYLNGKIHVLYNISDPELSYLYERCLFTVYPSTAEGWGLPVGESLMHGKACIASNLTSIPEVGGEFVQYINPHNVQEGQAAVTKWIDNPKEIETAVAKIRASFKPRSWLDVAKNLRETIAEFSRPTSESTAYVTAPAGRVLHIGGDRTTRAAKRGEFRARAAALVRVSGWWPTENWGSWSRSKVATLRFQTDVPSDSEVTIALRLSSLSDKIELTILSGGHKTEVQGLAKEGRWYFANGRVDGRGVVNLTIHTYGQPHVPSEEDSEKRRVFFGLDAFGHYQVGNLEQRLDLLQNIIAD